MTDDSVTRIYASRPIPIPREEARARRSRRAATRLLLLLGTILIGAAVYLQWGLIGVLTYGGLSALLAAAMTTPRRRA